MLAMTQPAKIASDAPIGQIMMNNNIRNQQMESALKRAICKVIDTLNDPRLDDMVTVTQLELSPDRRNMTVYISVNPIEKQARAIHALRGAARHIHARVSKEINLRKMPHLYFKDDVKFQQQQNLLTTINQAIQFEDQQIEKRLKSQAEPDDNNNDNNDSNDSTTPSS